MAYKRTYWERRIMQDEYRMNQLAKHNSFLIKEQYKDALKQIDGKIDRLYTKIQYGGEDQITRTELWQIKHYTELKEEIEKQCGVLGQKQTELTKDAIERVFENTIGEPLNEVAGAKISGLNQFNTQRALNTKWSGKNYSERIYDNTNMLATRLDQEITNMIVLGKSPEDIKKEIRVEFGVSYNQADRLIRTESSYAFNQACIDRYEQAGVMKVGMIVEDDACDECQQLIDQEFEIHNAPIIPIHPNCRCCYIPVID